ncbi:MAG: hypothetical protein U5S82_00245 [Gammaproteobacteria bacterium]|nr:hypothetical protein [Gammaproteobacteria bacterium]
MKLLRWLPWRYIVSRAARNQGFLDPIELMARLRSFAQPSEVGEPVELLRAGAVFHARGLINTRVIQNNLDWVWPYWIERQFDPRDEAFIPRGFSLSHINLTHRNWTAIGHPDCEELPTVDPRGLLTPLFDGWSLDAWVLADDGRRLLPSRARAAEQAQHIDTGLAITTRTRDGDLDLTTTATVRLEDGQPICEMTLEGSAGGPGWLVLALRPYNTEGVSFVHKVALAHDRGSWTVDNDTIVRFSRPATRHHVADYHAGDVLIHLWDRDDETEGLCNVGMVTAAALFPIPAAGAAGVTVTVPLEHEGPAPLEADAWPALRGRACRLRCPEARYQALYDGAVTSLILHSPGDVYPGPFTYKRFWFRDAAFLIHALLCLGLHDRAERALARFPDRQTPFGYFRSQEGEWDSNGEVLWILERYERLSGRRLSGEWQGPIRRAARWIVRKRTGDDLDAPHAGLLPAGFSAEHFGPNDYYYWDDFWGIAGLRAAHRLLDGEDGSAADDFAAVAQAFAGAVDRSLAKAARRLGRPGMPASPYRRLDAGAIGSLVVGYPLQACPPDDPRLLDCVEFLLDKCFVDDAFFQDMIHSGLNAYLTLHVAQVLLRAGDDRYLRLVDAVADLASPTGQWPEAIHPRTGGGCMGDGHHVWAAAEWILMIRHWFVREEGEGLVLCSGIPARWLEAGEPLSFGPAPTPYGPISITVLPATDKVRVHWQAEWRDGEPALEVRLPGTAAVAVEAGRDEVILPGRNPGR